MKDKILLFIPAYNCEKQITRVLDQVDSIVSPYIDTIMVVNNISTDNTAQVVSEYIESEPNKKINLHTNKQNYGLGGSHKVAFNKAIMDGFDYMIVLHGDDQGDINNLLPILKDGSYKNHECCLGSRFMKGSKRPGYSKFRTFGNVVYNIIFSVVTLKSIKDLGAGLNMYDVNMLKSQFYFKFPDNLTFNYAMVLSLHAYKQNAMFFPITWSEDDQVSNVKLFNQAFFVLGMALKYMLTGKRFLKKDLRKSEFNEYV